MQFSTGSSRDHVPMMIPPKLKEFYMKSMSKSRLAKAAGVKYKVFQRWLNDPHTKQLLAPCHLKPKQQILPPKAVQIIAENYDIEIN